MIPDYKLFNLPRRETMNMQTTLSYRQYLIQKAELLKQNYDTYVEMNWKDRTQEHIDMMSTYAKAMQITDKLLESMREADMVEIELEEKQHLLSLEATHDEFREMFKDIRND